jgi:hypothetical protein
MKDAVAIQKKNNTNSLLLELLTEDPKLPWWLSDSKAACAPPVTKQGLRRVLDRS